MTTDVHIYVGYRSALYYWRDGNTAGVYPARNALTRCPRNVAELRAFRIPNFLFGSEKVDLVVPERNLRVARNDFAYHVQSQPFPKGAFCDLGGGLYVASPELCFMQLAPELSVIGLMQLGLELCATYRLRTDADARYHCEPLVSAARLSRFVQAAKNMPGHKKAQRAVRHVLDDAASPMETCLYLRLCAPRMLGGYGLPKPLLNGYMQLTGEQRTLAGRGHLRGDLYWPDHKVLVEYNGEHFHTGRERIASDARRSNAVISKDVRLMLITADIYNSILEFDAVAQRLGKLFGARFREFTPAQSELRRELVRELRDQEQLTKAS